MEIRSSNGLNPNLISSFRRVVESRDYQRATLVEKIGEKSYPVRHSRMEEYMRAFEALTDLKGFIEDFERKNGRKPLVLDIMSYGAFIRGERLPGCSIARTDQRWFFSKKIDERRGNGFIVGNILNPRTFRRTKEWLEVNGEGGKFDLIVSRPIAGVSAFKNDPILYRYVINKAYESLEDGGVMLLDFFIGQRDLRNDIVENLNCTVGIYASMSEGIIMIRKTQDAPRSLKKIDYKKEFS